MFKKIILMIDTTVFINGQVEYMIIKFDEKNQKAKACLKAEKLLAIMDKREEEEGSDRRVLWRPEFASYMVEGTPGNPYGQDEKGFLSFFNVVQSNMRLRRMEMQQLLEEDEVILSITSFPRFVFF